MNGLKLGIDPRHGTRAKYVLGCRCDECRRANTESKRRRLEEARELVAHIPLNPGGRCPGIDGRKCPHRATLKSNSLGVCSRCVDRAGWNGLVDAAPVREHLRKLSRQGVGYKSAADAASVARSVLQRVLAGTKTRMRKRAADRVLAVDVQAAADHGMIPAGETRRMLEALEAEYLTKGRLALELGYAHPALQIATSERVLAKTEAKVRKLYRRAVGE